MITDEALKLFRDTLSAHRDDMSCNEAEKCALQAVLDFTLRQAARTCSDERPCINCYADQGECLGPAPETIRSHAARVDEAMVERAVAAYRRTTHAMPQTQHDRMRAALEAALSAQPAPLPSHIPPHAVKIGDDTYAWQESAQPAERQGVAVAPKHGDRHDGCAGFWCDVVEAEYKKLGRIVQDESNVERYVRIGLMCDKCGVERQAHPAAPVGVPDVVSIMAHLPDNRAATRAELIRAMALAAAPSAPQGEG